MWDFFGTSMPAAAIGWFGLIAVVVLVIYYILMGRTLLSMLRNKAHAVLLTFACIGLVPVPPTVIMGIVLMIVWSRYNKPA